MPTKYTAAELRTVIAGLTTQRDKAKARYERAVADMQGYNSALRDAEKALRIRLDLDAKNAVARDRAKAQKLAKQYGITIEREPDYPNSGPLWWVLGPDAVYGDGDGVGEAYGRSAPRADPCEGDHTCGAWCEVLGNVEVYVADMHAAEPGTIAHAHLIDLGIIQREAS